MADKNIPTPFKTFGANLRRIRTSRNGVTQQTLASKIYVSTQMISAYENGNSFPQYDKLQSICDALDTSLQELLGFDRNEEVLTLLRRIAGFIQDMIQEYSEK